MQSLDLLRFRYDVRGYFGIGADEHLSVPANVVYLNLSRVNDPLVRHDPFYPPLNRLEVGNQPRGSQTLILALDS